MKNKFRYSLSEQDYLFFERMQLKRRFLPGTIAMMSCFIVIGVYNYIAAKEPVFLIGSVCAAVISILFYVLYNYSIIKKKVKIYLAMDRGYLGEAEITIDSNAVEIKNIPKENEAGIIMIYPYSIMRAVVENRDYFFFYIGMEAKILPKKYIPDEMKQQVFSSIKNNRNYVYMK